MGYSRLIEERNRWSVRAHDAECALQRHKKPICGECIARAMVRELREPVRRWWKR